MSIKTKIGLLAAAGLVSGMLAASPAMAETTKGFGFTGFTTPAFQVVDQKGTFKGFTTATLGCKSVGVTDKFGRSVMEPRVLTLKGGKFETGAPCTVDVTGLAKAPFGTASKAKTVALNKIDTFTAPLAPLGKVKIVGLTHGPWAPYVTGYRIKIAGLAYDPLAAHSGLALYVGAGQPATSTS